MDTTSRLRSMINKANALETVPIAFKLYFAKQNMIYNTSRYQACQKTLSSNWRAVAHPLH